MNRGGQETYLMNLYRNIDRSRFEFVFLCTINDKGHYDDEIYALGGKIEHLPINTKLGILKPLINANILKKWLHEYKFNIDVFEIHTQHSMDAFLSSVAALKAGIKNVIVHSHNSNTTYHRNAHFVFRPFLTVLPILRYACGFEAGKWMFGKKDFEVVRNGIQANKFVFNESVRNSVRSEMGWDGCFVIGHVGRLSEQKNHKYLIDIFAAINKVIPNSKLVLIGDGELRNDIERYIEEKNVKESVVMLGVRNDTENLYQGMDLFLFPSLFEGLSVVLIEAQTADLTCLISDTITDENIITDNVYKLDIDGDITDWVTKTKEIWRKNRSRCNNLDSVRNAGYDISFEVKEVEMKYVGMLREENK